MRTLLLVVMMALAMVALVATAAAAADAGTADAAVSTVSAPEVSAVSAEPTPPAPADSAVSEPAEVPDLEADPFGSIEKFVDAVRAGNWKLVGAMALALLMLVLAKVRNKVKWFRGDRGGAVLVAVLGLAGGFSAALAAEAPIDWKLVAGIFVTTWTAVGGYTWVKRLIWPKNDEPTPIPVEDIEESADEEAPA